MILQFILGRAGTGKTYYCLKEITEELKKSPQGAPLILLVPEQATLLTEKSLLSFSDIKGIMRADVLSFQRMTQRVLNEVGGGAKVHIGDLGKRMLIRRLLQKHKDELKFFRWVVERPGFIENLDCTFTELRNYMITTDKLQEAFSKLKLLGKNDMLADKIHDLILVYTHYQNLLSDKYIESSNYLDLLAQKITEWSYLNGAEVWVDGFTGFTPQEYVVIREIMKKVEKFNMTLCLNTSELMNEVDESYLFYRTHQTMKNIIEIGSSIGASIRNPIIIDSDTPYRFKKNPVFAHLEKEFFNYPPSVYDNHQESIRIYEASNRRAEIEGAAREIIRLCRDEGYRFKDIYVMLRDLEPYKQLISIIFAYNDIPCFIDQKRLVMHHPLVELIRSALEVVIQNWSYDPVFRFLKTDLADIERENVDLLENYVLAHGIKGSKWIDGKPWTYHRKYTLGEEDLALWENDVELKRINHARMEAVKYIGDFHIAIKNKKTVKGYTEALFELLLSLNIPQKLDRWEIEAQDRGELDLVLEHAQIWDCIVDMMDEIVEGLGDEKLTIEEYSEVVESGLKNIKIGLLPLGMDQVVIGDLDRSRNPDVKVVFILGANDGVIPLRHSDEGTFTDSERIDLAKLKVELAPDTRSRLFDEQYYIYVALTRASDILYISYPLADEEGRALTPSYIIRQLRRIFKTLEEENWDIEPDGGDSDLDFISNLSGGLMYLPQRIRAAIEGNKINPIWWDVYTWFVSKEGIANKQILNGLFLKNQENNISKPLSKGLFRSPIIASVSQLERYQKCPFSHYISHGLRLKERTIYKLGAPDLGQFFHASMDMITRKLTDNSVELADLNNEECIQITSEVVDSLAPQLQNEILMSTSRYRYLSGKLKKTVERAVFILREHAKRGSFRPIGFELTFGDDGTLPPLVIELSNGVDNIKLRGRIDRVDKAALNNKIYLRVVDYKSGVDKFDLEDIYYGLNMQLLVYLEVVLKYANLLLGEDGTPGGIFHFKIDNPIITGLGPIETEKIEREIMKKLRMKGLVTADPDLVRLMDNQVLSGYSDLIPVALKKDDTFYKNSSIATEEQFCTLRRHLNRTIKKIGDGIISGNIKIQPYMKGRNTPCNYCKYGSICKFDKLLEENTYRVIKTLSNDVVWNLLERRRGED